MERMLQRVFKFLEVSADAVFKQDVILGAIKKLNNAPKSTRTQILKEVSKTKSKIITKSADFIVGFVFLFLFLVVSDPFGTDQADNLTLVRIYWGCGTILFYVGVYFTLPYLIRLRLTVLPLRLFYPLLILIYSICAIAFIVMFFQHTKGVVDFRIDEIIIFMVLFVTALVSKITFTNCRYRLLTDDQSEGINVFMDRLPHHIRGRLISLQANDHYLLVTTDSGTDLIRMNLQDAMDMLDDADGVQIHRSYWVSIQAVNVSKYDARNRNLHLPDGQILPVAKTRTLELLSRLVGASTAQ